MSSKCMLPNQANLNEVKNEIVNDFGAEGVFDENQKAKLAASLMQMINKKSGGGCKDAAQRDAARIYLISLSGLITFILQQVISRIRDYNKPKDELIKYSAFNDIVHTKSPTTITAELYSSLFSVDAGIEQLNSAEKDKFNSFKRSLTPTYARINNLFHSSVDILKSVGVFCGTLVITLISNRGLDLNMENVQAMAKEIIDNVYNNFELLINLSSEKISEGFTDYVEGKESTLSTILVPLEDWICNWLYKVRGGQAKKRKTRNNKRKPKKRKTHNKNKF